MSKHKINERVQEYWLDPKNHNAAAFYETDNCNKKGILLDVMTKFVTKNSSILEIGCNVGRNLNVLQEEGYPHLHGIEISRVAVEAGKKFFPDLKAKIKVGAIEDLVGKLPMYDVIFSLAVFEHIPTESEWVFKEIQKHTEKFIITIEDEKNQTWRHFPRNYRKVFSDLEQVHEEHLGSGGELDGFIVRVLLV